MKNSHHYLEIPIKKSKIFEVTGLAILIVFLLTYISSQIPTGSVIELLRDGIVGALGGCEAQTGLGGGALILIFF